MSNRLLLTTIALILAATSPIITAAQFGSGTCEKLVTEPSVNAIIGEVFKNKTEKLAQERLLSATFWSRNKSLGFAVCDNRASYDTFVVYGTGVVFDLQMIGFLFAQSRALVVGRRISLGRQFEIHSHIVRKFAKQGSELDAGPLPLIESKAYDLGMSKIEYNKLISEPDFKKQEQTLFLQAIYFLSMHERCHVALDHGTSLKESSSLPNAAKVAMRQRLELDADQCALEIINTDEAQFRESPVSFFGLLMTVATQAVIAGQPNLSTDRSHPSTRARISAALESTLAHISNSNSDNAPSYQSTIKGTASYFDKLLAELNP